jgi:hypothetical protein
MHRHTGAQPWQPPPKELEHFELWCVSRGELDLKAHVYTGDRGQWIAARRQWFEVYGWPGGQSAMLAGEVDGDEGEPWDEGMV